MSAIRTGIIGLLSLFLFLPGQAQDLVSIEYLGDRSQSSLAQEYGFLIQNGIEYWKVTYTTPDVFNQLDTASGLLVLPVREETTIYPLLVYQHGTVDGPQDVPSNLAGGFQIAEVFGGLGYVSLAPDFLGAGEARGFHPYVHRESEASAAVDMVRAVRAHAPEIDLLLNDQLFVTGYSQGGHASMALHQSLELELSDEFTVTAAAHLSGPYSISGVMRDVILSDEPYNFVAYLPNTYLSYNYVYGLYDDIEEVFKPAYVQPIQDFFDGNIGLGALNSTLIAALTSEFGAPITRNILQDSIVAALEDPNADHPIVDALRDNDTYEWAPQQPTRIFYCMADDQVNFRNSIVADSVMQELGAVSLSTADVNPSADHGQCVEPAVIQTALFFSSFADWTVDTDEMLNSIPLKVFPVPAQDWMQLEGLEEDAFVQLLNQQGQIVLQNMLLQGNTRLDISYVPAGLYMLQVQTKTGQAVRKIVVE
ncbi:MAG: T9SS type A sorting domain-containing protein [Bacteroidota bacterium]